MNKVLSRLLWRSLLLAGLGMCLAGPVRAEDLRIGIKAELTSADPHVLNGANRSVLNHIYETLVGSDANLRPVPALALSWRLVNPATWEFRLRPNVRFQNGAELRAEDVKYSIERAMHLAGPRTYRSYLREVDSITVTGPLTLQVKARTVSPTLPENLGLIAILPRSLGDKLSEESFASGKAAIGTGPYKFVSWEHGQNVVLARNPGYWGAQEPWDKVVLQFIPLRQRILHEEHPRTDAAVVATAAAATPG